MPYIYGVVVFIAVVALVFASLIGLEMVLG
jgi:hypothetical protein